MLSGLVGSSVFIEVETGDALEPDFSRLTGTVREVIDFGAGPAALIVDLGQRIALSGGPVNEMLILGEASRFGERFLESKRSQLTIRLPVLLYRASDPATLTRFRQSGRIPYHHLSRSRHSLPATIVLVALPPEGPVTLSLFAGSALTASSHGTTAVPQGC